MQNLVVIGAGEALKKHWAKPLANQSFTIGVVEQDDERCLHAVKILSAKWSVSALENIPSPWLNQQTIAFVLTPDHFPVIRQLAELGFKNIAVEKPLVSRECEIAPLKQLVLDFGLRIYAVDFYIPKLLALYMGHEKIMPGDARSNFLGVYHHGELVHANNVAEIFQELGSVEGISVTVLESGNFCLPDLTSRPWLRHDREIGGMLKDLGTHVFAPLITAGLCTEITTVLDAHLAHIAADDTMLVPTMPSDVEMYISALLAHAGHTISASFGKVPHEGGMWSVVVRYAKGMFYAGLRSGQGAVAQFNDGRSYTFTLRAAPVEYVVQEMKMYFDGELPGFDGNISALLGAMELNRKIREKYFCGNKEF